MQETAIFAFKLSEICQCLDLLSVNIVKGLGFWWCKQGALAWLILYSYP